MLLEDSNVFVLLDLFSIQLVSFVSTKEKRLAGLSTKMTLALTIFLADTLLSSVVLLRARHGVTNASTVVRFLLLAERVTSSTESPTDASKLMNASFSLSTAQATALNALILMDLSTVNVQTA